MIPESLVQQFRAVALERLDRIEQSWASVMGKLDEEAATIANRELHTLKGESRMLGFSDVNLVCHKLEDMLEVACARGYAIDEDFDLAVNMAIRFMAMLVRKKIGAQLVGIDLPSFIKQIDGILAENKPSPAATVRRTTGEFAAIKHTANPRMSPKLRERLAPIAAEAFIEYAAARGPRRDRLRASWHSLRDLLGIQRAVLGPSQLGKHETAHALAEQLGKKIELVFDLETLDATADILAAVDAAVLHIVNNAIDHGIESPPDRMAVGKSPVGRIVVRGHRRGDELDLMISDDGRGIALDSVRARGIARGALDPDLEDIEDHWVDLVCQPGFTTRVSASEISGRGVGLDAVRAWIHDVAGALTAVTTPGRGTTWTIRIPLPQVTLRAHFLRVPGLPFPVVVDESWKHRTTESMVRGQTPQVHDLAHRLGLVDEPARDPAVCFFERGFKTLGIAVDRPPIPVEVRRLVIVPAPALAEIVMTDAVECILVHLDRLL